jgi:galactitol-specific phosphotransferase system IIB component
MEELQKNGDLKFKRDIVGIRSNNKDRVFEFYWISNDFSCVEQRISFEDLNGDWILIEDIIEKIKNKIANFIEKTAIMPNVVEMNIHTMTNLKDNYDLFTINSSYYASSPEEAYTFLGMKIVINPNLKDDEIKLYYSDEDRK